jgi:hypothetical protein
VKEDTFIYRIDSTDTIVSVSDNWHVFADANAWGGAVRPEDVVGHKLWEFIDDHETRHLHQELFRRARSGTHSRPIPFRCDSPRERRFLELLIVALPDGSIQITSTILRTEPRSPVSLLDAGSPRSPDMVTVCSMCKKIRVSPQQWAEIEDGVARLRLFEADRMPRLTHGLCHSCYEAAMADLKEPETPDKAIDDDKE